MNLFKKSLSQIILSSTLLLNPNISFAQETEQNQNFPEQQEVFGIDDTAQIQKSQEIFGVDETAEKLSEFLNLLRTYSNCNLADHKFHWHKKEAVNAYAEYIQILGESEIPHLDKNHPDKNAFLEQANRLVYLGDDFLRAKMLYTALNEEVSLDNLVDNLEVNIFYSDDEQLAAVIDYLKEKENQIPKQRLVAILKEAFYKENSEIVLKFFATFNVLKEKEVFFEYIDRTLVKNFVFVKELYEQLGMEIPENKLVEKKIEILTNDANDIYQVLPYFKRRNITVAAEEWHDLIKHFLDPNYLRLFFGNVDAARLEKALYVIERMKADNIVLAEQQKNEIYESINKHMIFNLELVDKFYEAFGEQIPSQTIENSLEDILFHNPKAIKYLKKRNIPIKEEMLQDLAGKFFSGQRTADAITIIRNIENPSKSDLISWGYLLTHRSYIPHIKKGLELYKKADYKYDREELKEILNYAMQNQPANSAVWTPEKLMDVYAELDLPKDERSDIFIDILEGFCSYNKEPTIAQILEKTGINPSRQRLVELGKNILNAGYCFDDVENIVKLAGNEYSEEDYFCFAERMLKIEMQRFPIYIHPLEQSQIFHWGVNALKKSGKKSSKLFENCIESRIYDLELDGGDIFEAFIFFGRDPAREIFARTELQKEAIREIELEKQKESEAFYTDETLLPVEKIYADLIREATYLEKIDEKSAIDLREFILGEIEKKDISEGMIFYCKKCKDGKKYLMEVGDRLLERGAFRQAKMFYESANCQPQTSNK